MSKLIRVYVIVEGQTEQTFVREVLAPYMAHKNIFLEARLLGTSGHKGGNVNFERMCKDVRIFLQQEQHTYITTMVDYFRIDSRWPGKEAIDRQIQAGETLNVQEKADILEKATLQAIIERFKTNQVEDRFFPYVQMHEFESLLFSDEKILAHKIGVNLIEIESILKTYHGVPESINNDPNKAPSKRIEALCPSYRKVAMGAVIATEIGIQSMRQVCLHFDQWLNIMEKL